MRWRRWRYPADMCSAAGEQIAAHQLAVLRIAAGVGQHRRQLSLK